LAKKGHEVGWSQFKITSDAPEGETAKLEDKPSLKLSK